MSATGHTGPYVIDTPEGLHDLATNRSTFLYATDAGPVLAWMGDDDTWYGVRGLNEDDWAVGRRRLGQEVAIELYDADDEPVLPITILWHDGMWPVIPEPVDTGAEGLLREAVQHADREQMDGPTTRDLLRESLDAAFPALATQRPTPAPVNAEAVERDGRVIEEVIAQAIATARATEREGAWSDHDRLVALGALDHLDANIIAGTVTTALAAARAGEAQR